MVQSTPMGPPLNSPRETRRSGRRSAHSTSTSTSKSPDSDSAPRQPQRPPLISNNSNSSKGRRLKQEDFDDPVDTRTTTAPSNASSSSAHSTANPRSKRKPKEKDDLQPSTDSHLQDPFTHQHIHPGEEEEEEEEQGITRCVCGKSEDDPDAGEFMVQCETCKVWQHGGCMGYNSEDQLQNDDYYCEQCRPDLHVDLLQSRKSKKRHSSTTSHHTAARLSRSHSPSLLLKQPASKRRNTMNSRDAAFDENLEEILKTTAAEAAHDAVPNGAISNGHLEAEDEQDVATGNRNNKKRRRAEDDPPAKKRTRSMSTTSENPPASLLARDETPGQPGSSKATSAGPSLPPPPPPPPKTNNSSRSNKRTSRKPQPPEPLIGLDGLEVPLPPKSKSHRKGGGGTRRAPASSAHHGGQSANDGGRRGQTNGVNGQSAGPTMQDKGWRNSHAYAVSQQPLYTSWNLPDYLAHLEEMLPSETPQPLEVPGGRASSQERTHERGVKVKWPSKRTSVGDMNKRVRALVEWVGREQASALDRGRRMEALEKAITDTQTAMDVDMDSGVMLVDGVQRASSSAAERSQVQGGLHVSLLREMGHSDSNQTMKMMEELMEELIGFQERFGPGSKVRERRTAS